MKLSVMIINTLQRNKKQSEACSETSYSVTLIWHLALLIKKGTIKNIKSSNFHQLHIKKLKNLNINLNNNNLIT